MTEKSITGGEDIIDRLKDACNGHPHAKIAWPHRLLHDAVEQIEILRCGAFNYQKHIEAQDKEIGGLKLTISLQAKELADRGHLKTTGDSFEDRVRTALYLTGVKHPQQATTDNMIREIVMLVGLRLKTTGQDEKEVDLDALKRFPVWLSEADKVEWDSKCDRYNQGWNACIDHLASTGRISGWMPIESAPHGVNILVFVPEFADNGEDNSFMASGYCEDDGRFIPHEGEGDYEPTHWLPLPQPPEVKE